LLIWEEQVLPDRTGWLLDANYHKNPRDYWEQMWAQLRTMVVSAHETAVDTAMAAISKSVLEDKAKEQVVAFWEQQMTIFPALEMYVGPEIHRLKGIAPQSVVANGGFEDGQAGDPPALPGWDFYENYGMVKGVKAKYAWTDGSGHNGGKAVAFGEGQYPGDERHHLA
ncbi:MAG: hypothetical protein COZ05_21060, partial [Armatimonadetes bacterium CG_4_10_14_3_um_filter_59_10]